MSTFFGCTLKLPTKPSTYWWNHQNYPVSLSSSQSLSVVNGSGEKPGQTNKLLTRWPWTPRFPGLKAGSCGTPGLMRSAPPPGCAWPEPAGSSSTPSCWSSRPGWSRHPAGLCPQSHASLERHSPSTELCLSTSP